MSDGDEDLTNQAFTSRFEGVVAKATSTVILTDTGEKGGLAVFFAFLVRISI